LPNYDSILVQNQSALERFMLLLLGLNLKTGKNGILDFEHSAEVFGKGIQIIREIFGEQGETAGIHLKNMFNVSAPGFFKNLVFFGGPNINPAIVLINNLRLQKSHGSFMTLRDEKVRYCGICTLHIFGPNLYN
jgi:hypothetical protein